MPRNQGPIANLDTDSSTGKQMQPILGEDLLRRLKLSQSSNDVYEPSQFFDPSRFTQPLSQGNVDIAIANLVVRCASRDQFQVFDNVSDAGPQLVGINHAGEVAMFLLPY